MSNRTDLQPPCWYCYICGSSRLDLIFTTPRTDSNDGSNGRLVDSNGGDSVQGAFAQLSKQELEMEYRPVQQKIRLTPTALELLKAIQEQLARCRTHSKLEYLRLSSQSNKVLSSLFTTKKHISDRDQKDETVCLRGRQMNYY
jgi:hypothetical protein